MNIKHKSVVVGITALVLGLVLGYCVGVRPSDRNYGEFRGGHNYPNMYDSMGGMMSGLEGKTGDDLDKAFIDGMILHHEGAVRMTQQLLVETKRPELIKLGNDVITAQTGEIKMMQDWRKEWFTK